MQIWVLSQLVGSPGTECFLRSAQARGHQVRLLHPLDLGFRLSSTTAEVEPATILIDGAPAALPDVVFTRMGAASPQAGLHALLQLEALGVPVVNAPMALWRARDKVRSFQVLRAAGVATPASLVLGRRLDASVLQRELGPPPWIVKAPEGTKGEAVFLVSSAAELAALPQDVSVPYFLQRFVAESKGRDVRVFVIDGRANAAMRRESATGDFRSNLHLGGQGSEVELTPALAALAEAATRAHGLDVAGVDVLEGADGPLVIEVNGSPGFAGIEAATGRDLSGAVVEWLARRIAGAPSV